MKNQFYLKLLLAIQTLALLFYTIYIASINGWNFFEIATQNIQAFNWSGQFALDFSCYLILSALWIMWRNNFNIQSVLIGIIAMILGIVFFAPYLLYLLVVENGNLKTVLIGKR